MKVVAIAFEDSVNISLVVKGTPATITQGSNTLEGTVLVIADVYESPVELLAHTHNMTGATGLPVTG